ncbi:glycoside hydrolase family 97 N-terminal domain-containing protein [Streptomyces sp. NPDC006356]
MKKTARGSGAVQTTSTVTTPFATPWRVLVLGSSDTDLVDNAELVLNLAPANALTDTTCIRPGKVFRCNLTTAAGIAGVDFAVARSLDYVECATRRPTTTRWRWQRCTTSRSTSSTGTPHHRRTPPPPTGPACRGSTPCPPPGTRARPSPVRSASTSRSPAAAAPPGSWER